MDCDGDDLVLKLDPCIKSTRDVERLRTRRVTALCTGAFGAGAEAADLQSHTTHLLMHRMADDESLYELESIGRNG